MKRQSKTKPPFRLILVLHGLIAGVILIGSATLASAQAYRWSPTGSLNSPRAGHGAALLRDGKVLIAGGHDGGTILSTAELYDPTTGTWSQTGSLNVPRDRCTATLLPTGKILVVGGFSPPGSVVATNTAELYDPATQSWSLTGSLKMGRVWHSAILLRNGQVLVIGGMSDFNDSVGLNSAELYDPIAGTWRDTGNLNAGRYLGTATLLRNGKVLVAGGVDGDFGDLYTVLGGAELYDPNAGTWTATGFLNRGRFAHSATLLPNGDVLAVGGGAFPSYSTVNDSAELYHPDTGTWSLTGSLDRRSYHTATLLPSGKVLVEGGVNYGYDIGYFAYLDSAELYDPNTGTWCHTPNLNAVRYQSAATALENGKVLITGGLDNKDRGTLNSAEVYDPGEVPVPNSIDDAQFMVRQQYHDFLNREPDKDGLAFWTNEVDICGGDAQCIDVKRVNVSAAFYLSIEFQQTGYLVYRTYKAAYGNLPDAPVPIRFNEFLPDTQEVGKGVIVNQNDWEQVLENNKQAFADEFVQRARFAAAFPVTMTEADFVDKLNVNAGNPLSQTERDQLVGDLAAGAKTRAQVLRAVAENQNLAQREFNRAFVLMQYFGYLRRNPDDAPEPGLNFDGYNFWLNKLDSFDGNYVEAEMVKAFLASSEYRHRFGS
jgi:hypothetical protein